MFSHALYLFLLLNTFPYTLTATSEVYTATDFILLNCGESSNTIDRRNRSWDNDERSRYTPPYADAISQSFPASNMHPSVVKVPYASARVFRSPFTYTFPVLNGPKFVRLYFYPDTYSTFNTSQSLFSLTANKNAFTLLRNFSPYLNSPSLSYQPAFMKEFIINVQKYQMLNLTFSPIPDSFAFINGIEIVSIPDKLYFKGDQVAIHSRVEPYFQTNDTYFLKNDTAMEMLYRINVGGNDVEIQDDSGPTRGMFRAWAKDDNYILLSNYGYTPHDSNLTINYTTDTPPYSAPEAVYRTSRVIGAPDALITIRNNGRKSLDWGFPVDSGFHYLLRFHFCEIRQKKSVFNILIDNQPVEIQADVFRWTGGTGVPIYKDYEAFVPNYDGHFGKRDMLLSLLPNDQEGDPKKFNAILNGLEIFKLSGDDRSLAKVNPEISNSSPLINRTVNSNLGVSFHVIIYAAAATGGVLAMIVALGFVISRRQRQKVKDSVTVSAVRKSLSSNLCRYFLLDEIKTATANFDPDFVIGKGGFGNVYKGLIDDGATTVAIKRLNPSSKQGVHEFLTEIEMLSKLRHLHLVSLIGYSDHKGEMILVYDYMSNGTLRDHLYNSNNTPLNWKQRLQICVGSAKGLNYLHMTGAKQAIIHRDVKSTNILLDDKWVAKVSDFGLSKVGPTDGVDTHVTTVVKGSFGYVDPEYYRRQQLTDKSDVYSFGVVLFEVLCARPAINQNLPDEEVNLADWAKFCYRNGTITEIVDSNLDGQIAPECLRKFVETAVTCLNDKGIKRPSMSNIVWCLESAMQLQEAAEHTRPSLPFLRDLELIITTNEDMDMFSGTSELVSEFVSTTCSDNLKSADVFSELVNPIGR